MFLFLRSSLISLALVVSAHAASITAQSYIVTDLEGKILIEKNADEVRSIASITKLFTVRAAASYDPSELIEILPEDLKVGRMRSTPLRVHQLYSRSQLIELALVSSDNVAALALGRTELPPMVLPENTRIVEASGLDPRNVSTARELAEVARSLANTELAKTSIQPVTVLGIARRSTNPLLTKPGWSFSLSKTGYIAAAGGCLVVIFEMLDKPVVAVILGSSGVPGRWRDLIELRHQLTGEPEEKVSARHSRSRRHK